MMMLQLAKAEEPKLAQEAKAEFTGAGGAGTTAAAPGTTPAGFSPAIKSTCVRCVGSRELAYLS